MRTGYNAAAVVDGGQIVLARRPPRARAISLGAKSRSSGDGARVSLGAPRRRGRCSGSRHRPGLLRGRGFRRRCPVAFGRPNLGLGRPKGRPSLGLAEFGVLLFDLTCPPAERARANDLVGLAGPMDDQLPRLRVATPSGVEGGIGRPVAMMTSMNRSGHVLIVERPAAWVFGSKYAFVAGHVTDASSVGCVQRWSLIDLAVGAGYQRS
jgi:hypothetical protein